MPRNRDLVSYPTAYYWGLVQRVEAEGETVFPCTRKQAMTLQGEFYAWRRVCEARPEEAAGLGVDVVRLRNVALRVGEEGLTAMPEGETLGPKILGAVLGDLGPRRGTDVGQAAGAALAALKAKLGDGA